MSMSIGSSTASLRLLERRNRSKSTVSSSDTDVDSIAYTSSSGVTTPEDETQMFNLGATMLHDLAGKPTSKPLEKPTASTKHRNLSAAVKKVKRVAHALVSRKKKSDDISPILISSPLRERFGKRMSVKLDPDESFYSLPNRRFSLSDVSMPLYPHHAETITRKFGTISGSASGFAKNTSKKPRSGPRMPSFPESHSVDTVPSLTLIPEDPCAEQDVWTTNVVLLCILRVLLFVPWCAAVGGTLLLFPSWVELVAFGPGYLPSPRGVRRFAHWAECGQQHVMIFLACLVVVLWYNAALGASLTCLVVTRSVYVWHGFQVDKRIPLGEDDQQSVYLVVMGLVSADGSFCVSGPAGKVMLDSDGSLSEA